MTDTKSTAEVVKAEVNESQEWEFRADVRVRLHNPDGDDVAALRTYEARPKYADLTSNEDHVHETAEFWWTDSYPAQGDSEFADSSVNWEPAAPIDDDDALLEECIENATHDPAVELESLKYQGGRIEERLTKDTDTETDR